MIGPERRLTAVQIILLAADDLTATGYSEFSEFDLTVAAWNRDRQRFGLRGYANIYPDHKRVMMEIMGNKASNPILLKYMEKTRPNIYRLTPLGRVEASRLRSLESGQPEKANSMRDIYDSVVAFATHATFARWRDEPAEPEKWKDAAVFLGARTDRPSDAVEKMRIAWKATRDAIDWCKAQNMQTLPQGTHRASPSIRMQDLTDLQSFLTALKYRFPENLESEPEQVAATSTRSRPKPSRN
jgi:hypothetical protein